MASAEGEAAAEGVDPEHHQGLLREDREGHDRALMILMLRVADLISDSKEVKASAVESTAAICNRIGNKDLESLLRRLPLSSCLAWVLVALGRQAAWRPGASHEMGHLVVLERFWSSAFGLEDWRSKAEPCRLAV